MKTKKEEPTIVVTEKTGSYIFHSLYEALVFAGVQMPEGVKIDLPNTESPWQMYKVGYKEGYCDAVCKASEWLNNARLTDYVSCNDDVVSVSVHKLVVAIRKAMEEEI